MDRNQITGIVIITFLMILYMLYFGQRQTPVDPLVSDTTGIAERPAAPAESPAPRPAEDTEKERRLAEKYGALAPAFSGTAQEVTIENEDMVITFNSQGGAVKNVMLKNYLTDDKRPLYLLDEAHSSMSYIASGSATDINLTEMFYRHSLNTTEDSIFVTFTATIDERNYIRHVYALPSKGFELGYKFSIAGLESEIRNQPVRFRWKANLPKVEHDIEQSRIRSTVNYYSLEDRFDYLSETAEGMQTASIESPLKWVALKQKFFNTGIVAENTFERGAVSSVVIPTDTVGIKSLEAILDFPMGDLKTGKGNYKFYFGPNRYQILKGVAVDYDKNVYLGWPVINGINRFIVIPVFSFLESFIDNYGIIIIILVFLLKILLFPLSYKSYISMAKMKVLKPELDEIKAKYGEDMQKVQAEQMSLYQKVGINPLSGCIPVLLQMPILLAMFNFFPNSIELRGESFLWAEDLSTYDEFFKLPFHIKWFGAHVSMFTLLMTLSTLAYTWFNNQMSTVTGPMKTVSYVMPLVFMFVLNSFPAGLSFYYFVSNIVTIGQQLIIRKFVDEDKIRRVLDENRKKIASGQGKKSKWMQRVEEAMKIKEEELKKKKKK